MPIVITSLRLNRLEVLKHCVEMLNREESPPIPWWVKELERYDIAGIPVMRIALRCHELPPPQFQIPIEAIIQDKNYCQECIKEDKFTPLTSANASGYCAKHRDKDPRRNERKRSPKNRES